MFSIKAFARLHPGAVSILVESSLFAELIKHRWPGRSHWPARLLGDSPELGDLGMEVRTWLKRDRPIIGMIHLLPLPGAPLWQGSLQQVLDRACADGRTLAAAGFDAALVENYGDLPFTAGVVEPQTIAAMAWVLAHLHREVSIPMGVNVLRNDWRSALALASVCGGRFVRVNVHCGVMLTDQGIISGQADQCLRYRRSLDAAHIGILADVWVKHGEPLGQTQDIVESTSDILYRGLADAIIVTGKATGAAAQVEQLAQLRRTLPDAAIIVGSGINESNVELFASWVDAVIVGTGIKSGQVTANPVAHDHAERLAKLWKRR
jgi:uncharacterized protein